MNSQFFYDSCATFFFSRKQLKQYLNFESNFKIICEVCKSGKRKYKYHTITVSDKLFTNTSLKVSSASIRFLDIVSRIGSLIN